MSKILNFDLFSIQIPNGASRDFTDLLIAAQRIRGLRARVRDVNGYPVRWEELSNRSREGVIVGEVVKIRMNNLPSKAGIASPVENLQLGPDEGLGEGVAFLFEERRGLLVVQRNRYGLSVYHLITYFLNLTGQHRPILSHPLVSVKGLQRLLAMREVKRFEVTVATPGGYRSNAARNASTFGAINMLEESDASSVSVSLTVGKSNRSLNLTSIRGWARMLRSLQDETGRRAKHVKVRGTDANGEQAMFDVLEDWLTYSEQFNDSTNSRRVPFGARLKMLNNAVAHHAVELRELFDGHGAEN